MISRLMCGIVLLYSFNAYAEPGHYEGGGVSAVKKDPVATMETTVTGNEAKNIIKVSHSVKWAPMMRQWMSELVIPKFENLPLVSSIQVMPGSVASKTTSAGKSTSYVRESHVVIKLQLATPLSLMFDLSEEKNVCSGDSLPQKDESNRLVGADLIDEAATVNCSMASRMTLKGPVAVYGTFAGQTSTTQMLQNQVELVWSLGTQYSKTKTNMTAIFRGRTPRFQDALLKMLSLAKFQPVVEDSSFAQNPVRPTLKYMSRILRTTNEEIMKGQL